MVKSDYSAQNNVRLSAALTGILLTIPEALAGLLEIEGILDVKIFLDIAR